MEKKNAQLLTLFYFTWLEGEGAGVIWRVAMYMGEYRLHVTRPVSECFQKLIPKPADGLILLRGAVTVFCVKHDQFVLVLRDPLLKNNLKAKNRERYAYHDVKPQIYFMISVILDNQMSLFPWKETC